MEAKRICRICLINKNIQEYDCRLRGNCYALFCKECRRVKNRIKYAENPSAYNKQPRKYLLVVCSNCGIEWKKRQDTFKTWKGLCRHCVQDIISSYPHVQEARRKSGISVTKRLGGVPNAKHFTPDRVRGAANHKWRGGITPEVMKIRNSPEMKMWRLAVFQRDNYACTICSRRGGNLHADHVKPFAMFSDLRFDVDNGRTLCIPCHRKYGACVSGGKLTRDALLLENKHAENKGWLLL